MLENKIADRIAEAKVARKVFLEAVLFSGIIASKENKRREADARQAFILARADIWDAAEREFDSGTASEIVDTFDRAA